MNHRQRALAVLNYQPYDRLPIVHFGFLRDTLRKWAAEGHISHELAEAQLDSNEAEMEIARRRWALTSTGRASSRRLAGCGRLSSASCWKRAPMAGARSLAQTVS